MSLPASPRARTIVLGLGLSPLGAVVVASTASASPFVDALKGLVASDAGPADIDLAEGPSADALAPDGCDPSGCFANYYLDLVQRDSNDWPGTHEVSYLSVRNFGPATVEDALLRIDSGLGAVIESAPGCTFVGTSRAECPLGDIAANTTRGASVVIRPTSNQYQIESEVTSSTPNNSSSSRTWSGFVQSNGSVWRFTSVDGSTCPLVDGHFVATLTTGEILSFGSLPETRIEEDDRFVPSAVEPGFDTPVSVGIILDDSAALSPTDWQSVRQQISAFVQDWQSWSTAQGVAMPAFALYTTGPATRRLDWTSDAAVFNAAISGVARGTRAASLHASLELAGTDLAQRGGRRIALMISASTDADGAVDQDGVIARLNDEQVNAYAVAIAPKAQPLLRETADKTAGFAQTPGTVSGLGAALTRISGDLRGTVRSTWLTPFQDSSQRHVQMTWDGWWGQQSWRRYAPTAAGCASDCAVTRSLPKRYSDGTPFPVTLAIDTSAMVAPVTLTENLPLYSTPDLISHGGVHDTESNTIVWSFVSAPVPAVLGYSLHVPSNLFVPARFSGQFKDGGGAHRTCGEAATDILPMHPADVNNWGVVGTTTDRHLMVGYGTAWRHGSQWIRGAQQIPMAYVTRGMQILLYGGQYERVDELVPWRSTAVIATAGPRASARSITALPGPGASVSLTLDPGSDSSANAVEEVIPPGWSVASINLDGQFDPVARIIRWGPFETAVPRLLQYNLIAIDATGGELSGRFSVDGVDTPIGGDTVIGPVDDTLFANGFD